MPKFSENGLKKLSTCTKNLQTLMMKIIEDFDCTIVEGHRNEKGQNDAYAAFRSKLKWPNSKHNSIPSCAVDAVPYLKGKAIFGNNTQEKQDMAYFAGYVMCVANELYKQGKITKKIRWGGDWNRNNSTDDGWDFPHFEEVD